VWGLQSGRLMHDLRGHDAPVTCLAPVSIQRSPFAPPQLRYLLTGDAAGMLRQWDVTTGQLLRGLRAHEDVITVLRVHEMGDNFQIITASDDRCVSLWNGADGGLVRNLGERHDGPVRALELAPTFSRMHVVASSAPGDVRVHDLGRRVQPPRGGPFAGLLQPVAIPPPAFLPPIL
jgi:WD40 repeat protein